MKPKKFGALSSSVNPEELSLTFTSGIKLFLALAVAFGWVSTAGAESVQTLIPALVASGIAAWQAIEMLWGIFRKVIVAYSAN